MTSRRAQVRTLLSSSLQQGSGGEVVGDRDAVVSRTESYLAAVDVWATRGNQKAVSRVGPGLVAVCAWLAIKSLEPQSASMATYQKKSGLTPSQFEASAQQLAAGIKSVRAASSTSSPASSAPSTPRRRDKDGARAAATSLALSPQSRTPEALAKRARDVMSGAAFGHRPAPGSSPTPSPNPPKTPSGRIGRAGAVAPSRDPLSPSGSRATLGASQQRVNAAPHTPSKSSRLRQQAVLGNEGGAERGKEEDEEEEEEDDDEEEEGGLDSDEEEALQRGWTRRRGASGEGQTKRRRNEYDFAKTFQEGDEEVFAHLDEDVRAQKRLRKARHAIAKMMQADTGGTGSEQGADDMVPDDIYAVVALEL